MIYYRIKDAVRRRRARKLINECEAAAHIAWMDSVKRPPVGVTVDLAGTTRDSAVGEDRRRRVPNVPGDSVTLTVALPERPKWPGISAKNAKPCDECGCLKSNHCHYIARKGWRSHPCRVHNCPRYQYSEDGVS